MTDFCQTDLRAAVAAGHLTEAQAAAVTTLAQARAGQRAAMPAEDEPFEFFRGFSEIFVSIGIAILFVGLSMVVGLVTGPVGLIALPALWAGLAWAMAGYFTLRRRMNLPSMVLVLAFGFGVFMSAMVAIQQGSGLRASITGAALVAVAGLVVWYRRFRLPFTMAVLAGFAAVAVYGMTASAQMLAGLGISGPEAFFDLRQNPQFALSTLGFGLAAFAAAMWFDLQDPHRIGRASASAFWLHLAAAPALVNTAAVTMMNLGGGAGIAATAGAIGLITLMALVIDRRSFLTAGIVYIGFIIVWLVGHSGWVTGVGASAVILILLGGLLTALGTWWVDLRAALMRGLPDFPGKDRLPPYKR